MELNATDLVKQGYQLILEGKPQGLNQAEEIFNSLLNNDIDSPALLFHLASVHMKKGNNALALKLFKEAHQINPDFVQALSNTGFVYKQLNKMEEGREAFKETVKLCEKLKQDDKELADYYVNYGSMYVASGMPDTAKELLDKALTLDPTNDMGKWNRSLAYLEKGDFENGFAEYDYGDRTARTKDRKYKQGGVPFWDGTPGQVVAVYGEQGIGDELMFASMLPDIMKDCKIILDAHPRLQRLFQLNFPNIPVYGTRKAADLPWSNYHNIDAKISIGSLGKFYRKKKEDFPGEPYLKADAGDIAKYAERLKAMGPRKKIGISWRGGTLITNKNSRKIDMDLLLPLFECDADFISLQYDKDIEPKVKMFEEKHNIKLNHWQDVLDDYDETAGLISNLDLIISVPQSIVHLAGALGVPTIQLCPIRALWQMGAYGENMPWYSCVENIWQETDGDWQPVINKAKEKLCSLLQTNIAI